MTKNATEDLKTNKLRIQAAIDPIETLRDIYDENYSKLSYENAKILTETALREYLFDASSDLKEMIFDSAYKESYSESTKTSEINWNRVLNDYLELLSVSTAVRESGSEEESVTSNPYYREVAESSDPAKTALGIFRNSGGSLSTTSGRKILEACYQNVLSTLDEATRVHIFDFAFNRESESGWSAISTEYERVLQVVAAAKIPLALREELKEARESLQEEREVRNKRLLG